MLILALLLAYFIGSIPFGVLIGNARGVDVRAAGSGNIGATNVWRVLGPKAGASALILDVAKGLAGPLIGRYLLKNDAAGTALCGVIAVLGHTFSPFLKFRGGKGIATSLGALLGLMPVVALSAVAVWLAVLGMTRMVGAASIAACFALPICALLRDAPMPYFLVGLAMSVLAFVKHLPNLQRIRAGTEPKLGAKKRA